MVEELAKHKFEIKELKLAAKEKDAQLSEQGKKSAQIEWDLQALREARETEKSHAKLEREAAVALASRVPTGFSNVINDLDNARPVLRVEAARAFVRSQTYAERVAKALVENQNWTLKTVIGQLKKKESLPADFDAGLVINLGYNENFEEIVFEGDDDDDDDDVKDEFEELLDFDEKVKPTTDEFHSEMDRIRELAKAEMLWVQKGSPNRSSEQKSPAATSPARDG
jgi:hypothetical protein